MWLNHSAVNLNHSQNWYFKPSSSGGICLPKRYLFSVFNKILENLNSVISRSLSFAPHPLMVQCFVHSFVVFLEREWGRGRVRLRTLSRLCTVHKPAWDSLPLPLLPHLSPCLCPPPLLLTTTTTKRTVFQQQQKKNCVWLSSNYVPIFVSD